MFHELFKGGFCGCNRERRQMGSCDILWIIILLLILFNGGIFGLDICTLIILAVVFGGMFLMCNKGRKCNPCGH